MLDIDFQRCNSELCSPVYGAESGRRLIHHDHHDGGEDISFRTSAWFVASAISTVRMGHGVTRRSRRGPPGAAGVGRVEADADRDFQYCTPHGSI